MPAITITDLNNAKTDVDHIAAVATSTLLTATDRLGTVKPTLKAAIDTIRAFNSRGAWVTATLYLVKDLVLVSGTWYVAVTQHTASAAFATDALNWRVHQGMTAADLALPAAAAGLGFQPEGTGAIATTVQAQLRDMACNIKNFGAVGNGVADDSVALLALVNSGSKYIYLEAGKTYFSSQAIPVPDGVEVFIGNGANIIFNRVQTSLVVSSLFYSVNRTKKLTMEDMELQYTGQFDYGTSYGGIVAGIDINTTSGCERIRLKNIKAYGFNFAGIAVGRVGTFANPNSYIKDVVIEKCHSHNNRACGIWYGWVDGILLAKNRLEYNGLSGDIGTGYGCAGASDAYPKNVTVAHNFSNFNWRKGIDLHAGFNIIISHNQLRGNYIYGIALPIRNNGNGAFPLQPLGSVLIASNIISDSTPTGSFTPIAIQVDSSAGMVYTADSYNWKTIIKIHDNIFNNCRSGTGTDPVIQADVNGFANVNLSIRGNTGDVGNVSYIYSLSASPGVPNHPAHVNTIKISGDEISALAVSSNLIRDVDIKTVTNLTMIDNGYTMQTFNIPDGKQGITMLDLVKYVDYTNNRLVIGNMTAFNRRMIRPYFNTGGYTNASSNSLNNVPYPDQKLSAKRHIATAIPADGEEWNQGSFVDYVFSTGARTVALGWIVSTEGYAVSTPWAASTVVTRGTKVFSGANAYIATVGGTTSTVAITAAGVDGTVTWALLGVKAVFTAVFNPGP